MTLNNQSKSFKEGIKFIVVGILLILISILFHTLHLFHTSKPFWIFLNDLSVQIFSHLGIGALAIGILTFILDMNHWTSYFEKRLSNIVMDKSYLQGLNSDDLVNLQKELLKAYFKNDDIEIKDGFLHYYQNYIQKFIGQPYRKNVVMHLTLKEIKVIIDNVEVELFEVQEIMSYICKKNGVHLQENICYLPEENEHYSTDNFSVKLQHSSLSTKKGVINNNELIFSKTELLESCKDNNINNGFNLDIREYAIDDLNVMVTANYKIKKDRFFGWRMSHPTLDLSFIVNYPSDYLVSKEFYFSEDNSHTISNDNNAGNFFLKVSEWLLPDEGITLQLSKKVDNNTKNDVKTENITEIKASEEKLPQ